MRVRVLRRTRSPRERHEIATRSSLDRHEIATRSPRDRHEIGGGTGSGALGAWATVWYGAWVRAVSRVLTERAVIGVAVKAGGARSKLESTQAHASEHQRRSLSGTKGNRTRQHVRHTYYCMYLV